MSLRMALKRSLEDKEGPKKRTAYTPSLTGKKYDDGSSPAAATAPAAAATKTRRSATAKKAPPIVELVQIEKCIRNNMVSRIEKAGFVEMTQVLPSQFIDSLRSEAEEKLHNLNNHRQKRAADGFIKISNALQAIVSKDLADKVSLALMGSDKIHDSMKHVFGKGGESSSYEGYVVES